jgi:uncharacterized membrane protein
MFHITSAFLLVGGSMVAAILNTLARRAERPSEVAGLLGLIRVSLPFIFVGVAGTLVFGLWLWHERHFSFGAAWIWLSLALWVAANALGGMGGRRQTVARERALELAADGDEPSPELMALVRDPVANALNYGAGLAVVLILVLMICKPGS